MKNRLVFLAFLSLRCAFVFGQITAPTAVVCFEECADFELPDGSSISCSSGLTKYEVHFLTAAGADSLVIFPILVKAPINTSMTLKFCKGDPLDSILFCGMPLPGPFSCTSVDGCDSLINVNLVIIQVNAIISGSGSIGCGGPPMTLGSASSMGSKTWTNPLGQNIGTGDQIAIDQPGQYILTVKQAISPTKTCIARDTVVIGSLDPPIKKAFFTIKNEAPSGSATGAILVDSVSGGTGPLTFLWSNGATTQSILGLKAGAFWLLATDSLGCQKQFKFLVKTAFEPPPPGPTGGLHDFAISPNPTDDGSAQLFLPNEWIGKSLEISLFLATGQLLEKSFYYQNTDESIEIDLKNRGSGLFWLSIRAEGERAIFRKLIKI